MKNWKKADIGKRIIYRRAKLEDNEVIIQDANPNVPNTISFAEYPIIFEPKIGVIQAPIGLKSKIGFAYAVKNQKKRSKEYLKEVGDWCLVDKVSKDEMGVLEIIAKSLKKPLD